LVEDGVPGLLGNPGGIRGHTLNLIILEVQGLFG
jgi:hypothetical protein